MNESFNACLAYGRQVLWALLLVNLVGWHGEHGNAHMFGTALAIAAMAAAYFSQGCYTASLAIKTATADPTAGQDREYAAAAARWGSIICAVISGLLFIGGA
jgi:hypothetical protein